MLVGIELPTVLRNRIIALRSSMKDNTYPNHEPHITLFHNSFENVEEVDTILKEFCNFSSFRLTIKGMKIFRPNTHVFCVTSPLSDLRQDLIAKLLSITTNDHYEWMVEHHNLSPTEKENLKQTGSIISPEKYEFHATIGMGILDSQSEEEFEYTVNHITSFILYENTFKPEKRYQLKL